MSSNGTSTRGSRDRLQAGGHAGSSDVHLVGLAAGGDVAALGELYDRFAADAYGLALAVLQAPSRAEGAVEEGFLDVWRSADRFSSREGSVAAWILARVHRRAIARATATGMSNSGSRDREGTPPGAAGPLAPLPHEEREAIALARVGVWTRSEIAALSGVTADEVGKRMRSGLRRLGGPALAPVAERD